ncbi:MAG: cupin domain-containing protein [Pseudomonadota bacterium]
MQINADFSQRAVVRFSQTPWVASPSAGVERKMLDRIGAEVARATSLVRFAPGSDFTAHTHDGGEEYLVLDGTFADQDGAFPAGSYVRNPPTTHHHPAAPDGAIIFVKLHQFDPEDRTSLHARTDQPGLLFENGEERVEIIELAPGETIKTSAPGGLELLVLEGELAENGGMLSGWDWLRLPVAGLLDATASERGARLWMKTGHLASRPPKAPL